VNLFRNKNTKREREKQNNYFNLINHIISTVEREREVSPVGENRNLNTDILLVVLASGEERENIKTRKKVLSIFLKYWESFLLIKINIITENLSVDHNLLFVCSPLITIYPYASLSLHPPDR